MRPICLDLRPNGPKHEPNRHRLGTRGTGLRGRAARFSDGGRIIPHTGVWGSRA
jgi:hypothetical protein